MPSSASRKQREVASAKAYYGDLVAWKQDVSKTSIQPNNNSRTRHRVSSNRPPQQKQRRVKPASNHATSAKVWYNKFLAEKEQQKKEHHHQTRHQQKQPYHQHHPRRLDVSPRHGQSHASDVSDLTAQHRKRSDVKNPAVNQPTYTWWGQRRAPESVATDPDATKQQPVETEKQPAPNNCCRSLMVITLLAVALIGSIRVSQTDADTAVAATLDTLFLEPTEARSVEPPRCFIDHHSLTHQTNDTVDDNVMDVPLHCQHGVERFPCPKHGYCARGNLYQCAPTDYVQVSKSGTACVWTPLARQTARFLHATLTTQSVMAMCDMWNTPSSSSSSSYIQGRPLFEVASLTNELSVSHDPKLLLFVVTSERETNANAFIVQVSPQDGTTLVGLHPSQPLPLSTFCRVYTTMATAILGCCWSFLYGVRLMWTILIWCTESCPCWILIFSATALAVVVVWQFLWRCMGGAK